jgi:hypothetical protein
MFGRGGQGEGQEGSVGFERKECLSRSDDSIAVLAELLHSVLYLVCSGME